ncbi:MAG: VWA domain-containing protein [Opitutaceae bacterium]
MKTHSLFRAFAAAAVAVGGLMLSASAAKPASAPVAVQIDFDRPVLPADEVQRAIVKIGLRGCLPPRELDRQPVNLVIVLDRSGSMSGEKIVRAQEAAIEALHRLDVRDLFSLVIYDHEVATIIAPQSPTDTGRLERQIRGISSRGNTALFAGVSQGAAELRKNLERSGYVHRVLLLSDGLANVGPSSPDDLGRLGGALRREGISVTTIGLGDGFNEDLMTALAQRSDGNHYYVAESGDLPRIFAAELGDVLNVVAQRIEITVDFPAGVRVIRSIGREAACRDGAVTFDLNQLYGGQEKFLLVEVEVPAAKPDEMRTLARARVSYADAADATTRELRAEGQVRFSRDDALVHRSANQQVQTEYAANFVAEAKSQAIALADAGRKDEAAAVMRQSSVQLSRVASSYNNAAVAAVAEQTEREAEDVARKGIDGERRKEMRADAYKTTNQQKR